MLFCVAEVVEFQQSNDRRTGKPIAISVARAPNAKNNCEIISEKPASGTVLAEARAVKNQGVCCSALNYSLFNYSRKLLAYMLYTTGRFTLSK